MGLFQNNGFTHTKRDLSLDGEICFFLAPSFFHLINWGKTLCHLEVLNRGSWICLRCFTSHLKGQTTLLIKLSLYATAHYCTYQRIHICFAPHCAGTACFQAPEWTPLSGPGCWISCFNRRLAEVQQITLEIRWMAALFTCGEADGAFFSNSQENR